jgi:ribosomal protein S27AE
MLPHRPRALDPDFAAENSREASAAVPQDEPQRADGASVVEHHSQICPTCGHQLSGHHCKLVCTQCGYYMSCADYY